MGMERIFVQKKCLFFAFKCMLNICENCFLRLTNLNQIVLILRLKSNTYWKSYIFLYKIYLRILTYVLSYHTQFNGKTTSKKNVTKVWSTPSFKAIKKKYFVDFK